jgi:hypothetical protein
VNESRSSYDMPALGAVFIDARQLGPDGSRGPVLASSHLWESKDDALKEVLTLLSGCVAVEE